MLKLLKRWLGMKGGKRDALCRLNAKDEAEMRKRLWVLRELDGRDVHASLDEETSARLRTRKSGLAPERFEDKRNEGR